MPAPSRTALWKPEDLGTPIPPTSEHAVSVAMPLWNDVVGYEKGEKRVIEALRAGYPRFVFHPITAKFFRKCEERFAKAGEFCIAFPSLRAAKECVAFVEARTGIKGRVDDWQALGVHVTTFPETARGEAKAFWQHAGYTLSSRLAEALLEGRTPEDGQQAKRHIITRLAGLYGENEANIRLYPSGIGAVFAAYNLLDPNHKTIQLGFPYVDTLKIQEKFGRGVCFLDYNDVRDIEAVERILKNEKIAGLICEYPSNPLLHSIDLGKLSTLLRTYNVPLIIDDTVGTVCNVDLRPYADIIVTSLTKFFSGVGDVLSGSLILSQLSPLYPSLKAKLEANYEDICFGEDAIVLERNSRDFKERMVRINHNAEILADFLHNHPSVAHVAYPKHVDRDVFDHYKRTGGGYGGLLSFWLKNPEKAPAVYDRLEIDKGPSLGTNFTLACPYTILAHFNELDLAEKSGIPPHLIRVSVGLEDPAVLVARFEKALAA